MKFNLKKIFFIAGGVVILLAIVLLILTRQTSEPKEDPKTTSVSQQEEILPQLPPASEEEQTRNYLLITGASFVERFGSYSNQGDFQNIKDLYPLMTPSLKTWSDGYVKKQIAERPDPENYYGLTTKVASRNMVVFNYAAGYAKISVSTQRREAFGETTNEEIFYQDAEIEFKKIGEDWLVDGIWWK